MKFDWMTQPRFQISDPVCRPSVHVFPPPLRLLDSLHVISIVWLAIRFASRCMSPWTPCFVVSFINVGPPPLSHPARVYCNNMIQQRPQTLDLGVLGKNKFRTGGQLRHNFRQPCVRCRLCASPAVLIQRQMLQRSNGLLCVRCNADARSPRLCLTQRFCRISLSKFSLRVVFSYDMHLLLLLEV
jgi:hypothetical protein